MDDWTVTMARIQYNPIEKSILSILTNTSRNCSSATSNVADGRCMFGPISKDPLSSSHFSTQDYWIDLPQITGVKMFAVLDICFGL